MSTIQSVQDAVHQLFQSKGWNSISDPEEPILQTAFTLDHPQLVELRMLLSLTNVTPPECDGLRVIASANLVAPPQRIPAAAELISRINFGLLNGNFELDYDDGEIRYKTYVNCHSQIPHQDILEDAIRTPIFLFQYYGSAILAVLEEGTSASEALAALEGDS